MSLAVQVLFTILFTMFHSQVEIKKQDKQLYSLEVIVSNMDWRDGLSLYPSP